MEQGDGWRGGDVGPIPDPSSKPVSPAVSPLSPPAQRLRHSILCYPDSSLSSSFVSSYQLSWLALPPKHIPNLSPYCHLYHSSLAKCHCHWLALLPEPPEGLPLQPIPPTAVGAIFKHMNHTLSPPPPSPRPAPSGSGEEGMGISNHTWGLNTSPV